MKHSLRFYLQSKYFQYFNNDLGYSNSIYLSFILIVCDNALEYNAILFHNKKALNPAVSNNMVLTWGYMLSEIFQIEKYKNCITYMWNLKKPKETESRKVITRGWEVGILRGCWTKFFTNAMKKFLWSNVQCGDST